MTFRRITSSDARHRVYHAGQCAKISSNRHYQYLTASSLSLLPYISLYVSFENLVLYPLFDTFLFSHYLSA